jgi:hypothetical protein
MKKFWNQTVEFKSLVISIIATVLAFGGTAVLFWFKRYDIPLATLTSGLVVIISWLILYLNKKKDKPAVKLDILAIYLRLTLVVILAITFAVLELTIKLVTVSPVFLVVSYLGYSLINLLAYIKKGENV